MRKQRQFGAASVILFDIRNMLFQGLPGRRAGRGIKIPTNNQVVPCHKNRLDFS